MYTETIKCGTVRGSLTCDSCGFGYFWQKHTSLSAAIRRARADGWIMGTYHTCPACEKPKRTIEDIRAYNRAYQRQRRERRAEHGK